MYRFTMAVCFSIVVCLTSVSLADIPKLINYQGMLTDDSGNPLTGTYDITFKIYNASSEGDERWAETQTDVAVTDGLFNVILGGATVGGMDLNFSEEYWLEITVEGELMGERMRFTSVGYAYRALVADSSAVAASGGGWVDDGAVVRLHTSTDEVGVGTTNPGSRLDIKATTGNSDGGLRITSSTNANPVVVLQDAVPGDQGQVALRAGNSDKVVLRANGDSYFNGGNIDAYNNEIKRYYGFPRPDYSTGWQVISQGQTLTFTHSLAGSANDYVVDVMFYDNSGGLTGPHRIGYGGWRDDGTYGGAYWHELDNSKIKVTRASSDVSVDWVRVRIWVIRD
jgi:hypothetical protein